jgi:hypothetical protein
MNTKDVVDRLAREAGLPVSLACIVMESVRETIAAEYPHLADKVDALLADEDRAAEAIRWIVKLASSVRPDGDTSS